MRGCPGQQSNFGGSPGSVVDSSSTSCGSDVDVFGTVMSASWTSAGYKPFCNPGLQDIQGGPLSALKAHSEPENTHSSASDMIPRLELDSEHLEVAYSARSACMPCPRMTLLAQTESSTLTSPLTPFFPTPQQLCCTSRAADKLLLSPRTLPASLEQLLQPRLLTGFVAHVSFQTRSESVSKEF